MQVIDPRGRSWTVGIRWLPRRPRRPERVKPAPRERSRARSRGERGDGNGSRANWLHLGELADAPGLVALALCAVVAVVLWFTLVPLAILVLDVLFLVVVSAGGIASRVLLRRPWIVDARADGRAHEWNVVGYRNARREVHRVAALIAEGEPLDDQR